MAFSVYPSGPHKCHLSCHSVQIYENTVLDLVLVNFWKGPGCQQDSGLLAVSKPCRSTTTAQGQPETMREQTGLVRSNTLLITHRKWGHVLQTPALDYRDYSPPSGLIMTGNFHLLLGPVFPKAL